MSCFETALANLANDVNNTAVTTDQVIVTCESLEMAYGVPATECLYMAIAEARLKRWTPPVRFH